MGVAEERTRETPRDECSWLEPVNLFSAEQAAREIYGSLIDETVNWAGSSIFFSAKPTAAGPDQQLPAN